MSEAEQATFFSRFGSELHDAITRQHESVVSRLDRLEFLHQMSRPMRELRCLLQLRQQYTTEEIGHFKVLVEIAKHPQPSMWIGAESQKTMDQQFGLMLGQRIFFWTGRAEEKPTVLEPCGWCGGLHDIILFAVGMSSTITGEFLDQRMTVLYVSEGFEQKIAGLWLSVNGYALFEPGTSRDLNWFSTTPNCPWLTSPDGRPIKWMSYGSTGLFGIEWSNPRKLKDARLCWERGAVSKS